MTEKKSRPTYTEEQKAEVRRLLKEDYKQDKVVELTGVGKGTVVKIAAELKAESATSKPIESASTESPVDSLNALKETLKDRINKINVMLGGELERELGELLEKEKAIDAVLKLYK